MKLACFKLQVCLQLVWYKWTNQTWSADCWQLLHDIYCAQDLGVGHHHCTWFHQINLKSAPECTAGKLTFKQQYQKSCHPHHLEQEYAQGWGTDVPAFWHVVYRNILAMDSCRKTQVGHVFGGHWASFRPWLLSLSSQMLPFLSPQPPWREKVVLKLSGQAWWFCGIHSRGGAPSNCLQNCLVHHKLVWRHQRADTPCNPLLDLLSLFLLS